MTCAIMQPTYLPWLGYFDLIQNTDMFVFLDHVQFSKQSWQQRNKIRDKNGEILLTVPIKHTLHKEAYIRDIKIDHIRMPLKKHLKSIQINYSKTKNYHQIKDEIEYIYTQDYELLLDFNIALIKFACRQMNLLQNFVFSSDLNIQGEKVETLINICKTLNATHYLSPLGSKMYIDENNIFEEHSIQLSYQNYTHPIYRQYNYSDFISHLSFIDYLFNK